MKCPHASEFQRSVNMTPREILAWSKDPRSKCYSFAATRRRLPALAKLKAKPVPEWTADDCRYAQRVLNFNRRMEGGLRRDGCTPGYAISLMNWGRKPQGCAPPKTCARKRPPR